MQYLIEYGVDVVCPASFAHPGEVLNVQKHYSQVGILQPKVPVLVFNHQLPHNFLKESAKGANIHLRHVFGDRHQASHHLLERPMHELQLV